MVETNSKEINAIVWAYSEEKAFAGLKDLTGVEGKYSNSHIEFDGYKITFYVRYHEQLVKDAPQDLTDILILLVDDKTIGLAKEYLDIRRGIPFRFINGGALGDDDAKEIKDLVKEKEDIFKAGVSYDKALREVFKKIDANGNGILDRDEIIKAAKELNHDLLEGDANEIVNILGTDGKVTYHGFKHWWNLGRFDFSSFRELISVKMKVTKFIDSNLTHFNSYLDSYVATPENSAKEKLNFKFLIHPTKQEDREGHKTSFNFHMSLGDEYDALKHTLPSYYSEALTIGIEIPLKSTNSVENTETLNQITALVNNFLFAQGGVLAQYKSHGLQLNSRLHGEIAMLEFSLGGIMGDFILHIAKNINIDKLHYSGHVDAHISSKFSLESIFNNRDQHANDLLKEALKILIEEKGNFKSLYLLVKVTLDLLSKTIDFKSSKADQVLQFFKAFSMIKNFNFDLDYDVDELYDQFPQSWKDGLLFPLTILFAPVFGFYDSLDPYMMFADMFSLLRKCDLDKISVFATTPLVRALLKITVIFKGLNTLLDKAFEESAKN